MKSRKQNKDLPTISVIVPTLNAASVLGKCIQSIREQNYSQELIEIIVADGGSTDKTLTIAKKYGTKIYKNPLKTGEAGKAVAVRQAKNELIALIDSDNILPNKNWLSLMVEPFKDREVFGSEPIEYTWRKGDGFITRYCALTGVNDPLCLFLGNYDRTNLLTGKWTEIPLESQDKGGWLKITLPKGVLPTIGANGTILRRSIFDDYNLGDYLVDIDVIYDLVLKGKNKFAKVKVGIIHLYCGANIETFIRKQKRRIKDFLFLRQQKIRHYPWEKTNKLGFVKFIFYCLTILPLFLQTFKGFLKKPDSAWFFHPLACWITLYVYAAGTIQSFFKVEALSRQSWSQ